MPITSHQSSGMISGQQAMFGNMASYARQISPGSGSTPTYSNPMSGMGSGFAPPPPPTASPVPSSFGASVMSKAGGAAMPALAGLGLAGSFLPGAMGRAAMMTDPFSAGLMGAGKATGVGFGKSGILSGAGWKNMAGGLGNIAKGGVGGIARAGLAGLSGAAATAAPILALGAAAKYGVGQMTQGAQFEGQVHGQLQQNFRHVNSKSRTGFGFSRGESGKISDMLQDMGSKDMMTSSQELKRVMGGAIQMGLMKSVQDVKEFKSRFKKTVGALKEISKAMNTTLEGAIPFFQAARQSGFWTTQDITRNASAVKMTAQATGMNVSQVQQMQTQGAQMARSVGAVGSAGAKGMSESLKFVGGAMRGGVLSGAEMGEATGGLSGTEAIGSMAGTLQAATTRFASSRRGRWALAALGGKGFKGLDPAKMAQLKQGRLSIGQIGSMARKNIASEGAFNFVNKERDLRGDMVKQGPQAQLGLIAGMMGKHLYSDTAKSQLISKRIMKRWFGVSGRQAGALIKMARSAPEIQRENEARSAKLADAQERQQEELKDHTWEGAKRKASRWMDMNISAPLKKAGASMSRDITDWGEETSDKFWGRTSQHRKFRGIQTGAIQAIQKSFMGDDRAMDVEFGTPGVMEKVLGRKSGGGGGGLGMERRSDEPMTAGRLLAGEGRGRKRTGSMSFDRFREDTTESVETLKRWGVKEHGFKTEEEREKAIGKGGLMRGASVGAGSAVPFRAMETKDVERVRSGLAGAQGVLTKRTIAGMGFKGDVKGAEEQLEGVQSEMEGIPFRRAAMRAEEATGGGQKMGMKLVEQARAGKFGERMQGLVTGVTKEQAVQRISSAQKRGGKGMQVDLTEDEAGASGGKSGIGVTEKEITEYEDKAREDLAGALTGGGKQTKEEQDADLRRIGRGGTRGSGILTLSSDFEKEKGGMVKKLKSLEKKGGAAYKTAMKQLSSSDDDIRLLGKQTLMGLSEQDEFKDERDVIDKLISDDDPQAKEIAKSVAGTAEGFQARAGAEFEEVMKRRKNRLKGQWGGKEDRILEEFNKVKGDRGKQIGDILRRGITGKQGPEQVRGTITELTRAASEADQKGLQRIISSVEELGIEGGEHYIEALKSGMSVKQDIKAFQKSGDVGSGRRLAMRAGVGEISTQQLKTLRKGSTQAAAKVARELTKDIDDPTKRAFAERALGGFSGKATDEQKQKLLSVSLSGASARAMGQTVDANQSIMARQKSRDKVEAGQMFGDEGSLKGIHGELTRQTKVLDAIRGATPGSKKVLGMTGDVPDVPAVEPV